MTSHDKCPNCSQTLYGQYCSNCGQNQKGSDRYFLTLVTEAFEGVFSLDSKLWKTIFFLMFRPGFLTREHFANRRARYISPLRLYLASSIAFFLLLSTMNFFSPDLSSSLAIELGDKKTVSEEQLEQKNSSKIDSNVADLPEPVKVKIYLPVLGDEENVESKTALAKKIKSGISILKERPKMFLSKLIDSSPPVVLLLLPLFAIVLKLFYLSSGRFYTQHLVLAVHNHSFLFIALFILVSGSKLLSPEPQEWLSTIIMLWVCVYMVLSLKFSFEQRWLITGVKSIAISVIYFFFFVFALLGISLLGIISL